MKGGGKESSPLVLVPLSQLIDRDDLRLNVVGYVARPLDRTVEGRNQIQGLRNGFGSSKHEKLVTTDKDAQHHAQFFPVFPKRDLLCLR